MGQVGLSRNVVFGVDPIAEIDALDLSLIKSKLFLPIEKEIINHLVEQYEKLFGKASHEVCKESVQDRGSGYKAEPALESEK